jgi:hypothetical protein
MKNDREEVTRLLMGNNSGSYTGMQVDLIAQKPELFDIYVDIFLSLDGTLSRRAAWVITHAVTRMPELVTAESLEAMLKLAGDMKHDAEKRNLAKVLSQVVLPDKLKGEVLDLCFNWLNDPGESIAVRAYCMDTLTNLTTEFPEIKPEIIAVIENHMDRFSPGLKNKGVKMLRKLR